MLYLQPLNIVKSFLKLALNAIGGIKGEEERIAKERLKICEPCNNRKRMKCGMCGCYLPAKVLSDSRCPIDKW